MQSAETPTEKKQEQKKPRSRKTTPRGRGRRNSGEEKKLTPRRRASPRNREKTAAAEQEKEKQEEEVKEQVEKTEEKVESETQEEVPPSQDQELRRDYLQRIYRQLQTTHPSQDDAVIRQIATNLEMEICRKASTKDQYVAALDQEIHKLMQFEMAQVNKHANESQSFDGVAADAPPQVVVSSEMQNEHAQVQMTQSRHFEFAQALAKFKTQSDSGDGSSMMSTPRQSVGGGDGSFQTLMASQSAAYEYDSIRQQQDLSTQGMGMQMGNQYYPASSASQSFSMPSNAGEMNAPRNMMEVQQQLGAFQDQQYAQQPGSMRSQQRPSNLQEFTAQVQHLDNSVLIELLWNQRNALAQWQRRANQLELQLATQRSAANSMRSPGLHSPYNSPIVSGSPFVSPNIATEAEMQRARERNSARISQQSPQYPYGQRQYNENNAATSQNGATGSAWGTNPQLYWEKIRILKAAHAGQLLVAHRALTHHNAPPNSVHSIKAQSVKNNIVLVLNILNESPKAIQPRAFEVLTSIERFIQATVIPIVQKVQSSGLMPPITTGSQTVTTSGRAAAVTTTVATHAPGAPPAQENSPAMATNIYPGVGVQYPGARWTSSNEQSGGVDMARQYSRGASTDIKNTTRDADGSDNSPGMDFPTRAADEMSSENYQPNRHYGSVSSSRDNTMNGMQLGSCEDDDTESQRAAFEASTAAPEESPSSMMPTSQNCRTGAGTETRFSPDASPNAGGNERDTSKTMEAPSVEDSLNDFSDFPELDFEDQLQGNNFVKENYSSNGAKKREIEDV